MQNYINSGMALHSIIYNSQYKNMMYKECLVSVTTKFSSHNFHINRLFLTWHEACSLTLPLHQWQALLSQIVMHTGCSMGPHNLALQGGMQQLGRPEDPLFLGKTCTHSLNEDDLKTKRADSSIWFLHNDNFCLLYYCMCQQSVPTPVAVFTIMTTKYLTKLHEHEYKMYLIMTHWALGQPWTEKINKSVGILLQFCIIYSSLQCWILHEIPYEEVRFP